MPRNLLIVFFVLLGMLGCAGKQDVAEINATQLVESKSDAIELNITALSEETLFMASVLALQNSDVELAKTYLLELYKKTDKELYLYQLIQLLSQGGKAQEAMEFLRDKLKNEPTSVELKKSLVTLYLANNMLKEAKELSLEIAKSTKSEHDYDLSATISVYMQDYVSAVQELKVAYSTSHDETILDKLATILFVHMNKKDEALSLYETHVRLYGYSKYIAERMALAYEQLGKRDEAIPVYKKLYTKFGDQNALKRLVELYLVDYKVNDLIQFLQKTSADDVVLLEAYKYKKDFVMASRTAMKIYKKTKDAKYLAQSAIYKFEANTKKSSALIQETVTNLTVALKSVNDDVFENYLGYLLIDYDLDVARGVELAKKALLKEQKSPFYLDTLAWGLYKQKKCKDAYEAMKQAYEGAKDDATVKEHYEAIKKCVEKK